MNNFQCEEKASTDVQCISMCYRISCNPFKMCVHVSSLRVIMHISPILPKTMQTDRGLTKNDTETCPIKINDCKHLQNDRRLNTFPMPFRRTTHFDRNEILRKPAGRLGVVSPCERSENKEEVWGRGVVETGAFFGRNRRCLGCRF